jgi:hypothetical protein
MRSAKKFRQKKENGNRVNEEACGRMKGEP